MLKVGGLRFFNRHILPNEAFVCRGGILLVVLEIHVVLLGIDSISPPMVALWIKLPRRDQSEALQKDLLEADLMVSMRKLWLPWNDLPGHFVYYFTVLIATSHMGQTHIFCLLTFFGTPKKLSDSSSCAGGTGTVQVELPWKGLRALRIESLEPPLPLRLSWGLCFH